MTRTLKAILFYGGALALCAPPLFVFAWMILTGLKTGVQNISYPPEFIFLPTLENFRAPSCQPVSLLACAPEAHDRGFFRVAIFRYNRAHEDHDLVLFGIVAQAHFSGAKERVHGR